MTGVLAASMGIFVAGAQLFAEVSHLWMQLDVETTLLRVGRDVRVK